MITDLIVNAISFYVVAYFLPGFTISGWQALIILALVWGLISIFVRPILKILTFPINILTLGLFSFVLNALLLLLAAKIVPGFAISGFLTALWAAIILSLINAILRKQTRLISLIVVVVLAVTLIGGKDFLKDPSQFEKMEKAADFAEIKKEIESKLTDEKESEIEKIDETWNQYTNYELGFSIKTPIKIGLPYGGCEWKEGEESYRPTVEQDVPTKIYEKGKNVYIVPSYFYQLTQETRERGISKFRACNKVENSLEEVQREENYLSQGWTITIEEAKNDAELELLIKSRFGSSCMLGEKSASTQGGVFDVRVKVPAENENCFINYAYTIKYQPEKNKVFFWTMGQACNLYAADYTPTGGYDTCYDQEIINSLIFL